MGDDSLFDVPRYRENPSYVFIEQLIVDTIEGLPHEEKEWLAQTLQTDISGWRAKIKQAATLSDTFEIAVLDLWYRNSQVAAKRGDVLTALDFAQLFVDNYFADDSQVDVWGPGALEAAKARIAAAQELEKQRRQ